MSDSNEITLNGAIAAEMQACVGTMIALTTLSESEIAALIKFYDLDGFFMRYAVHIIDAQMGVLIAEIVLSILKLKQCSGKYMDYVTQNANDNPSLSVALKIWIIQKTSSGLDSGNHNETYPHPEPPEEMEPDEQDEQDEDDSYEMGVGNE